MSTISGQTYRVSNVYIKAGTRHSAGSPSSNNDHIITV